MGAGLGEMQEKKIGKRVTLVADNYLMGHLGAKIGDMGGNQGHTGKEEGE